MASLKQWVRDLTLILLLAHALELAIPFGTSRRYVRLGAGLILLLALLQPLLTLLRADFEAVLLQAADGSAMAAAVETRVGLVREAQTAAVHELGHRLSAERVANIAATYGAAVERTDVDETGRVIIWLQGTASGAVRSPGSQADGDPVPAFGALAHARFVSEVAAALGIGIQRVEVRWSHEGEGFR